MFARPVLTGVFRKVVLIAVLSSGALLCAAGTASAQTTETAVGLSVTRYVLGVPLGTAAWVVSGIGLLIAGMFAALRSGHRGSIGSTLIAEQAKDSAR